MEPPPVTPAGLLLGLLTGPYHNGTLSELQRREGEQTDNRRGEGERGKQRRANGNQNRRGLMVAKMSRGTTGGDQRKLVERAIKGKRRWREPTEKTVGRG